MGYFFCYGGGRHCDRLFALEREYDGKDKDGNRIWEPLSPEEKHRRRHEEMKPLLDAECGGLSCQAIPFP